MKKKYFRISLQIGLSNSQNSKSHYRPIIFITLIFSYYYFRNDSQVITDLMRYSSISEVNAEQQRFFESAVKSLIRRLRRSQERGIVDNLVRFKGENN